MTIYDYMNIQLQKKRLPFCICKISHLLSSYLDWIISYISHHSLLIFIRNIFYALQRYSYKYYLQYKREKNAVSFKVEKEACNSHKKCNTIIIKFSLYYVFFRIKFTYFIQIIIKFFDQIRSYYFVLSRTSFASLLKI